MPRRCDSKTAVTLGAVAATALVGAAAVVLISRRRRGEPHVPRAWHVRRLLRREIGHRATRRVLEASDAHMDALWASRPRFQDRGLAEATEDLILPALALYRALRDAELEESHALGLVEVTLVGERRSGLRLGSLARRGLGRTSRPPRTRPTWLFAPQGWELEWLADGEDLVAFDVLRCFYVDATEAYGSPELAAVFCALDDFSGDALGAGVASARAQTIARGGDRCSFRFERTTSREDLPPSATAPRVIRFPHERGAH